MFGILPGLSKLYFSSFELELTTESLCLTTTGVSVLTVILKPCMADVPLFACRSLLLSPSFLYPSVVFSADSSFSILTAFSYLLALGLVAALCCRLGWSVLDGARFCAWLLILRWMMLTFTDG